MSRTLGRVLAVAAVTTMITGCATAEEWSVWKSNTAHFASGDHMTFSARNRDGAPRVSRADVDLARAQNWWGRAITVDQSQILGN